MSARAKHSPALAARNLRHRITATRIDPADFDLNYVNISIPDAETLLKERDALVEALEAAKLEIQAGGDWHKRLIRIAKIDAALASARGAQS